MNSGYWEEGDEETLPVVADDVVDLSFALAGGSLVADHAWALSEALRGPLPWFAAEPLAGLHLVHTAASGNGWTSPADLPGGMLHLSRRARLVLRLPHERLDEAQQLVGATLDVAGSTLQVGASRVQLLSPLTTLYCRHVVIDPALDEERFLAWVSHELQREQVRCRRIICGRDGRFAFPDGMRVTRSLMLADLSFDESQQLQRRGIGPGRHTGFGLFVPHKAVSR